MKTYNLNGGWTVEPGVVSVVPEQIASLGAITASVPGSVHTDLLAAGLIDDPYLDGNEAQQTWIGASDWTYRRQFDWQNDGSERQELVFDGLDTVAAIAIAGRRIGATRNMHRSYRFDVASDLAGGPSDIEVAFSSPIRAADAASLEQGYRPHVNHHPYNALRKMACSFGWDWGPDTSTSGMWRGVRLETWSTARIADLRVVATVINSEPVVTVAVSVDRTGSEPLHVIVRIGDREVNVPIPGNASAAEISLNMPDAELWWPVGHGEQPLYTLDIELVSSAGPLDRAQRRIGFRSVTIDTTPDDDGAPFTILVNGEPILVRGANWIPDDAFPHRVDRARYAHRLEQAQFAGINLIRVWGGGIYESEDFYAECDERGILVWQDFLFACAAYAEEEPLRSEIELETREAVTRLGTHPSLVLLNGNNENIWGHQEWGWQPRLEGRSWGSYYYYDYFPRLVSELAPHVAYTPGSPFSPDPTAQQNDPAQGSVHLWDLWNTKDYPHYRDYRPRFVAEFGWQGPPTWASLVSSVTDSPLTPESPGMLVHQKAAEGNVKLIDGLVPHLPLPNDIESWHWAMSLNQAVAIRTGIEWFRSLTPHCSGTVVWQLNDCWPVTSWAAIDGYGRAKPLLFALREAHAEQLLTIQPDGDGLVVAAVNDTAEAWTGSIDVHRVDYSGKVLDRKVLKLDVPPRGAVRIPVPESLLAVSHPEDELLLAQVGSTRSMWFFADYRFSHLTAPRFDVDVHTTERGDIVRVTAHNLIRDVHLMVDKLAPDATVDNGLVTLLPGESALFVVVGTTGAEISDYEGVIYSANDLCI